MIGDLVGYRDQGDLDAAFRDDDLRAHFRTAHPTYVAWRNEGCNTTVNLIGGREYTFNIKDTFLHVRDMILVWDETLRQLMTGTTIPDETGLDHRRVCEIFALHVTADMPLPAKG